MKNKFLSSSLPLLTILLCCTYFIPALADDAGAKREPVAPFTVVTALENSAGSHPGFRRNHAKGICALGEFTASKEAKAYSRSEIFTGKSIPVIARFSVAGGVPTVSDQTRNPRGLALQFQLKKQNHHNMSMLHTPIFAVATPDAFYESILATTPDAKTGKPDPDKIRQFASAHPEFIPFAQYLKNNNPPASYATASYGSLNAFEFSNAKHKNQFVRWRFEPKDGVVLLSDDDIKKANPDFLNDELTKRVAQQPMQWKMMVTLAEPADTTVNPTVAWPTTRTQVDFGTLKLSSVMPQEGGPCDKLNFDPTQVSDGVAISDDPILKFRAPAYAISYGKRLGEKANGK